MSSATVVVSGRLSRDAEESHTKNGSLMVRLSIPVKVGWGENETTNWYTIRVTGKRAETLAGLTLRKGTRITASGQLEAKTYQANDGTTKLDLSFFANDVDIDFEPRQQPPQQPTVFSSPNDPDF